MPDQPLRCGHQHWVRLGGACGPCFVAYWRERLPVGTRVTYDDEVDLEQKPSDLVGVIAEPTADELEYAQTYGDPVGPEAGDVLVQWGSDEWDRSWEDPRGLQVIDRDHFKESPKRPS